MDNEDMVTYTASDGRTITRQTFYGKEGDVPFCAWWYEGYGNIGDRIIGRYRADKHQRVMSGEMFNCEPGEIRREPLAGMTAVDAD